MRKEEILDQLIDEAIAGEPPRGDDPLAGVASQLLCLNELRPRPEAKDASRYLMLACAVQPMTPGRARKWLRLRLTTIVASCMALTMATSGTVYAASNSLPGDTLYPVKEATENVGLAFVPSGPARAEAQIRLARTRLAELKLLMQRKDKRRIGLLVRELNRRLRLARSEGGLSPAQARRIKSAADSMGRSSTRWLTPVPGSLRRRIKAPSLKESGAPAPNPTPLDSRVQTERNSLQAPNRPAPKPPRIIKPSRPVIKVIRSRPGAR